MTKYEKFFHKGITKKEFIQNVLKEFPTYNPSSIRRRYYDVNKKHSPAEITNRSTPIYFPENELKEPISLQKMLIIDAKRMKYKITKEFLLKHGFKQYEINWLIKNKEITYEDDESDE